MYNNNNMFTRSKRYKDYYYGHVPWTSIAGFSGSPAFHAFVVLLYATIGILGEANVSFPIVFFVQTVQQVYAKEILYFLGHGKPIIEIIKNSPSHVTQG